MLLKLYLAMGVVTLPLLLLHPLYVLPAVREQLHQDRVHAMRQVVEMAYGVLESYEARVRKGELTTVQAQAEAARLLQVLRYDNGAEYFWVNDLSTRLVMHPYLPAMLGKDLTDYQDVDGKRVFVDIVTLAREQGEGFIRYRATRPGEERALPKESYVKLFTPWGWVVGTGVYLEDIEREVVELQRRLVMAAFAALLLVGLVGLVFSRLVVRPIGALSEAARRVARGDLRFTVPVSSEDEVGQLGQAFNTMVTGIRETVRGIADVAVSTVADAERIRHSADILSHATREQCDQLQHLADAVQEMSRDLSQGAQRALNTAEAAANNGRVAKEGGETVDHASRKISEIVQVVQHSAQTVARLQASSEVVTQMLRLIQDVSNETNILAVNTAIEAARAGEHGKGFGVVASEVRKLAHRSHIVVLQIEQLLKQNQEDTSAAATLMRQGTAKVEEGMRLSSATGEALARIVTGVRDIHMKVGDMAAEGSRQSITGENISERIKSLSINSMESVAGVEQIAQAVVDLHAQAKQLWALSERFSSRNEKKRF
ncbi:methyl-accepting chemotaxis protein [Hyalangium rubrum]|uniref:Methyl-accepting chemotaxis protein n=1 Tax=Hyalangium rubrum TaxID=3103134 RepID=A0ABU5GYS9_9BACT|nr:methyl-accepting chemotaxis protein [Hyalangium sp. s54d21]MDY7226358.1 methyl-accepting chemotaxis protein [Hyalangium sp. s54d21]